MIGFITVALGLILLTVSTPLAAVPVLFMYGLGVGLVLTGINLTVSSMAGGNRGTALSWLDSSGDPVSVRFNAIALHIPDAEKSLPRWTKANAECPSR